MLRRDTALAILKDSEHLRDFPQSFLIQINSIVTVRRCIDGEMMCRMNEPLNFVWIVRKGALYSRSVARNGSQLITGVSEPGNFVGLSFVAGGLEIHSDVIARGSTEVLQIPVRPLAEILNLEPRLWKSVAALIARRLRVSQDRIRALAHATADEKTAWILLTHARHSGFLNDLENRGLIRRGYRPIALLKTEALELLLDENVPAV